MKFNLQFFAKDRTNMVSLLDIGSLFGGKTPKIVEMGDGFKEITEDWGPNTESVQYVNMQNAANTVKGYAFSMSPARDYLSDEMQDCFDDIMKKFPTDISRQIFQTKQESASVFRLLCARLVLVEVAVIH